jgi:hypothetical protein
MMQPELTTEQLEAIAADLRHRANVGPDWAPVAIAEISAERATAFRDMKEKRLQSKIAAHKKHAQILADLAQVAINERLACAK